MEKRSLRPPVRPAADLPRWFERFLAPGADRCSVLLAALEDGGVAARVVSVDGGRHIVAWPRGGSRDRRYRFKLASAHYDRVPGTPGALDNSAACAQLVRFALQGGLAFNTLAVFTDREELGAARPTDQGSYGLGRLLAAVASGGPGGALADLGLVEPVAFSLDVTGRGDALVLSRAPGRLAGAAGGSLIAGLAGTAGNGAAGNGAAALGAIASEIEDLASAAERLMAGRAPVFRAGLPFGEDLGYLLAGIPALLATVLPRAEAEALALGDGLPAWASLEPPGTRAPDTWRDMHGPGDTVDRYTPEAFELAGRYLERLASLRLPARPAAGTTARPATRPR